MTQETRPLALPNTQALLPDRSAKLVVGRKVQLPPTFAAKEVGYQNTKTNNTLSVLLSTILALQSNKKARTNEVTLNKFLATQLNGQPPNKLTRDKILYLLNGDSNNKLSEEAQHLIDCSDAVVRCLHEHVIKNTARAMDVYDLADYIEAAKEGLRRQEMSNPGNVKELDGYLGNRNNLPKIDEFLKRLKEVVL